MRQPPRSTRTDALFPCTPLVRSGGVPCGLRRGLDLQPARRAAVPHRGARRPVHHQLRVRRTRRPHAAHDRIAHRLRVYRQAAGDGQNNVLARICLTSATRRQGRRARGEHAMDLEHLALEQPGRAAPDRTGTQSLGRGIKLMRMIATRPAFGWRLSDLAAACKQDKGTVHRMLACLVEERLVTQRPSDRRYLPGPLMYELGLAIPARVQFQRRAESVLQSFARRMGGIALLLLRSGNEYVCSRSEEHTSELQSLMRISYAVFCLKKKKQP